MELRDLPKAAVTRGLKLLSLGLPVHLHLNPPLGKDPWLSSGSACQVQGCEGPGEPVVSLRRQWDDSTGGSAARLFWKGRLVSGNGRQGPAEEEEDGEAERYSQGWTGHRTRTQIPK